MRRLFVAVVIIAVLSGLAVAWWQQGLSPVNATDKKQVVFVVPKGANVRQIANDLKEKGLIRDPIVFFLLVKRLGLDGKIQAGAFRLLPSMNAETIAQSLTHGTLDIWITIPEGKRAEEVAEILKETIPTYQDAWKDALVSHEGYLFPDTYLIPRDATIEQVVSIMRGTFDKKYASISSNDSSFSQEKIVTIASMVEREARHDEDRPLVASVIFNRLEKGMALQIDATVQYALGYDENERTWWKKGLTMDDLKMQSPYNTYENIGLPPKPIANPGLEVLNAVVNPAETDYLYYISDKSGVNHYAKTLAEHNANIKRYDL